MGGVFIVESPNKVPTIQGYLDELFGRGAWLVVPTGGHWRGLPAMKTGKGFADAVDVSTWVEQWEISNDRAASKLRSALHDATHVLLASDGDREGEAIAWHIVDAFGGRKAQRAVCTEITKAGVKAAVDNPRPLDLPLVDAQRTRALLDYEIGMGCSRLLWRFGAKSAGRVQSAALRIIVDREAAIRAFATTDFWTLSVTYAEGFTARVASFQPPSEDELDEAGDTASREPTLRPVRFASRSDVDAMATIARQATHVVEKVETKQTTRKPPPAFKTSTLLAEAARRLKWKPDQTSNVSQTLFEKGAVTYIRTDSVSLSDEAVTAVREHLRRHAPNALPETPQRHSDKANAQGAHEAIRPVTFDDAAMVAGLSADEATLYALIRNRTIVSQARNAALDKTVITVSPGAEHQWRLVASGTVIRDQGFLALLDGGSGDDDEEDRMPHVKGQQRLSIKSVDVPAGRTQPPARFTAASLIAYLDRRGIGRPGTLKSIFETLDERGYVVEDKKMRLSPSELGTLAERLLRVGFDTLTAEHFTATTEKSLDAIADGKLRRIDFLTKFHAGFSRMLAAAEVALNDYAKRHPELDALAVVDHDKPCSECGAKMVRRRGKFGHYAQCTAETCAKRVSLEPLKTLKDPCPKCDAAVVEQPYAKDGKRSKFYRCTSCDWTSAFKPDPMSKWPCHADADHGLMSEVTRQRDDKSTFTFYLCRVCDSKVWSGPKPPPCPSCSGAMRLVDNNDDKSQMWICSAWKTGCRGKAPLAPSLTKKRRKT